jgi:predicted ferric reductase
MLKRIPFIQYLVWAVILFVVPLPLIQALAMGLPAIYSSEALAIQAGSIAYVWFLVSIYLSTRPKWLDRLIGLPSIYFIHGMLSIFGIVLAYLHKSGTSSAGLIKLTGDWSFDLFIGLMIYSLVFMAGWLSNRVKILGMLKHGLEKIFKHELSVWLHRLNIVAVILVFIHVQLISYITSISAFIWLFDAYSLFVLLAYSYTKIKNAYLLPTGKLIEKKEIAPNFFEYTIQMAHPQRLTIKPGDYVFINFPKKDHLKELHPFSVVNDVQQDGQIVLAIRGDGDFTKQTQELTIGSQVQIDGSYGKFDDIIQQNHKDALVLIGGGSGIVPLLSIVQACDDRQIDLYYSTHRTADLIYEEQLKALAAQRRNLTVHIQEGRFNTDQILHYLDTNAVYLLSGPNSLGRNFKQALLRANVPADKVYYEEFSW